MTVEADYLRGLFEEFRDEILVALKVERDNRPLLRVAQVAELLGISERSVKDMLIAEKIPSFKIGVSDGVRVVSPADLDAYITAQRHAG